MQDIVKAIREDKMVGRGSCSTIDEAYTDEELIEALMDDDIKTVKQGIRWARKTEKIIQDYAEDIRNA